MVFLRTFLSPKSIWVDGSTIQDCEDTLSRLNIPISEVSFYLNGKKFADASCPLPSNATVDVVSTLPGGKGGFGSMLRALGAQIEKTTNKDACRDLSGRRLRDINEEDRLKKYVAQQAERERLEAEKKEAKMAKLRRMAKGENKHEFSDPKYDKEREEATDRVHEAMEAALKKDEEPKPCTSGTKRKQPEEAAAVPKKKGLWIAAGISESDLEDSSDEDD